MHFEPRSALAAHGLIARCPASPSLYDVPMIPVMRPRLPLQEEVAPWLSRMDENGVYSNFGPLVAELERNYAERFRVDPEQVVSVSSATLGIEGAIRTTDIARWWVPDFTFPATGLAVLEADRALFLCDVDEITWELPDSVGVQVGADEGIIPVMAFGAPIELARWQGVRNVIIDAAASLGSSSIDLSGLPSTWSVVFSLHATKVLPAGEGGIVVFGDVSSARTFRAWSNFGFRGTRESTVEGTNAKMSEIHAAYGLSSLHHWPIERAEWLDGISRARETNRALGLRSSRQDPQGVHPYWVVDIGTPDAAEELARRLSTADIAHRFWWPSLHTMPAFHQVPRRDDLSNSLRLSRSVVGLPMYRGIDVTTIERIALELEQVLECQTVGNL